MLLQVVQNIGIVELIGGGTLGSIATMIVQKLLSHKKDKVDIVQLQLEMLSEVNKSLNDNITRSQEVYKQYQEVIEELLEQICYTQKCDFRISGNTKIEK